MAKTVAFVTLGCKVNQYDSQAMLEKLMEAGYQPTEDFRGADVCVINTCTVTGTGDKKSMQLIRRCRRENPKAELVIAGCLAQRMGEELLSTGARLVMGNQRRGQIAELLAEALREDTRIAAVESVTHIPYEPLSIHSHEGHTRAVMKIQEGCDRHCTYCIIPSVRGNIRSRLTEDIRAEAETLAAAGFREMVLTGIHLTSYGRDLPERLTLADAIRAADVPGVERIRLGSLEPGIAKDAFIDAIRDCKALCPQFHLALQSGSDEILRRMKRGYNTTQFMEAVKRLRAVWPLAAFTTDVIVGFPGETEEHFQETLAFCEAVGFARIHVFPFSPREGTPAQTMPDQIPEKVKSERVRRLIELGEALALKYERSLEGQIRPVLIEEETKDGTPAGYIPEYVYVRVAGAKPGDVIDVRLTNATGQGMTGVPV